MEKLSPKDGAFLLLQRAGLFEQASQKDWEIAEKIAQEVGGLPLVLNLVGAYIKASHRSIASFLQSFDKIMQNLLKERPTPWENYPASVAATLLTSFDRVKEKCPEAAALLSLFAYLEPDTIDFDKFRDTFNRPFNNIF